MKVSFRNCRAAAGLLAALILTTNLAAAPKKLLVVTATQGFRHSSIPLAEKVLAGLGEQSGVFTVDFARGGANGKESADIIEKMSPDALKNYDGVIFCNTTGDLPIPDKDAFLKWIFTLLRMTEILLPRMVACAVCHWPAGRETNSVPAAVL